MDVVVIILVIVVNALAGFMLYREFQHRVNGLEARVKKLEGADPKRLPFRTQDDVLDVIALLDMVEHKRQMEEEVERAHKEHEDRLLKDAKIRLQKTLAMGTKRDVK